VYIKIAGAGIMVLYISSRYGRISRSPARDIDMYSTHPLDGQAFGHVLASRLILGYSSDEHHIQRM